MSNLNSLKLIKIGFLIFLSFTISSCNSVGNPDIDTSTEVSTGTVTTISTHTNTEIDIGTNTSTTNSDTDTQTQSVVTTKIDGMDFNSVSTKIINGSVIEAQFVVLDRLQDVGITDLTQEDFILLHDEDPLEDDSVVYFKEAPLPVEVSLTILIDISNATSDEELEKIKLMVVNHITENFQNTSFPRLRMYVFDEEVTPIATSIRNFSDYTNAVLAIEKSSTESKQSSNIIEAIRSALSGGRAHGLVYSKYIMQNIILITNTVHTTNSKTIDDLPNTINKVNLLTITSNPEFNTDYIKSIKSKTNNVITMDYTEEVITIDDSALINAYENISKKYPSKYFIEYISEFRQDDHNFKIQLNGNPNCPSNRNFYCKDNITHSYVAQGLTDVEPVGSLTKDRAALLPSDDKTIPLTFDLYWKYINHISTTVKWTITWSTLAGEVIEEVSTENNRLELTDIDLSNVFYAKIKALDYDLNLTAETMLYIDHDLDSIFDTDTDFDNDGMHNTHDLHPLDPSKDRDYDLDGIFDLNDDDDDGDGVIDSEDIYPYVINDTQNNGVSTFVAFDEGYDFLTCGQSNNNLSTILKIIHGFGHEFQINNNSISDYYNLEGSSIDLDINLNIDKSFGCAQTQSYNSVLASDRTTDIISLIDFNLDGTKEFILMKHNEQFEIIAHHYITLDQLKQNKIDSYEREDTFNNSVEITYSEEAKNIITDNNNNALVYSLAEIGDVNGDNFNDYYMHTSHPNASAILLGRKYFDEMTNTIHITENDLIKIDFFFKDMYPIDFNGDGIDDIIYLNSTFQMFVLKGGPNLPNEINDTTINDHIIAKISNVGYIPEEIFNSDYYRSYEFTLDLNGDGKEDLVFEDYIIFGFDSESTVEIDGYPFLTSPDIDNTNLHTIDWLDKTYETNMLLDHDGDGNLDILYKSEGETTDEFVVAYGPFLDGSRRQFGLNAYKITGVPKKASISRIDLKYNGSQEIAINGLIFFSGRAAH